MRLCLLFATLSCFGCMEHESYKPTVPTLYWFNTRITLDHPDGPIHLSVRLKMSTIPASNTVVVNLRVMHKGQLLGGRQISLQWEDQRRFNE